MVYSPKDAAQDSTAGHVQEVGRPKQSPRKRKAKKQQAVSSASRSASSQRKLGTKRKGTSRALAKPLGTRIAREDSLTWRRAQQARGKMPRGVTRPKLKASQLESRRTSRQSSQSKKAVSGREISFRDSFQRSAIGGAVRTSLRASIRAYASIRHAVQSAQAAPKTPAQKASAPKKRPIQKRAASRRLYISGRQQKLIWAGGAISLLAMVMVLPTRVSSQDIDAQQCQQVVQSGAELSRGEMGALTDLPMGASPETVQAAIDQPYCTLPVAENETSDNKEGDALTTAETASLAEGRVIAREAYPLAFDPQTWVVVSYGDDGYQGYDFLFKE